MNSDVARTLTGGQKIKYWDDRIATVSIPYSGPPDDVVAIVFDQDTQTPKAVHYIKDFDFRLAEPL